jgi:hypothetical protein
LALGFVLALLAFLTALLKVRHLTGRASYKLFAKVFGEFFTSFFKRTLPAHCFDRTFDAFFSYFSRRAKHYI